MNSDSTARLLKERAQLREQHLLQLGAEQQREEQRLSTKLQLLREQLYRPLPEQMSVFSFQCHCAQRLRWQQELIDEQAALDALREARRALTRELLQAHLSQEQLNRLIERHRARLADVEQRREQHLQDDLVGRRKAAVALVTPL